MNFKMLFATFAVFTLALVSANSQINNFVQPIDPIQPIGDIPAPIDSNVARPTDPPSTTPVPVDPTPTPVNPAPIDPYIKPVNPDLYIGTAPIEPTPISPAPVEPTPTPVNPAPIEGGSSGGGSGGDNNGGGGRRRNNGGNDDEGGRKRIDSNLSLEESNTILLGNDDEKSGWSAITGAVIGVLGKKGALGIGILMVVLGVAGTVVYNRERFGLVKKAE